MQAASIDPALRPGASRAKLSRTGLGRDDAAAAWLGNGCAT